MGNPGRFARDLGLRCEQARRRVPEEGTAWHPYRSAAHRAGCASPDTSSSDRSPARPSEAATVASSRQ